MIGNNFEWVADFYLANAYALTPAEVTDPTGPTREQSAEGNSHFAWRVARGGGFIGNEMSKISHRNSWRIGWPPFFFLGNTGLRLALDLDDDSPAGPLP